MTHACVIKEIYYCRISILGVVVGVEIEDEVAIDITGGPEIITLLISKAVNPVMYFDPIRSAD